MPKKSKHPPMPPSMTHHVYAKALLKLQIELVKLQRHLIERRCPSWSSSKAATPPARTAPSSGSSST